MTSKGNIPSHWPHVGSSTDSRAGSLGPYITNWYNSVTRSAQYESQAYYDGEQSIQSKQRLYLDKSNKVRSMPDIVPNTRLTYNLYRKIIDQKIQFITERKLLYRQPADERVDFTDPSSIESSASDDDGDDFSIDTSSSSVHVSLDPSSRDKKYDDFCKLLARLFDRSWESDLHSALIDCLIDGDCWLYPYVTDSGEFSYKFFRGRDICPIYTDESHDELSAIIRVFGITHVDPSAPRSWYVEIYRKDGMTRHVMEDVGSGSFVLDDGVFTPYIQFDYASTSPSSPPSTYSWSEIPFVHIKTCPHPRPFLNRCKSILDSINQLCSNWCDNILENPDGSILVVQNYSGGDVGALRQELHLNRVIMVHTTPEAPGGGVNYLEIPVKSEDYLSVLGYLRKSLFECTATFDEISDSVLSSNLQELPIRTAMMAMEQDANLFMTSIEFGIKKFVDTFFIPYLCSRGFDDYSDLDVVFEFDDIRVRNVAQITNLMVSLGLKISNRTMLEHHPWVTDVGEEMDRIISEQNMLMAQTAKASELSAKQSAPFGSNSTGSVNTGSPNGGGKSSDFFTAAEKKEKKDASDVKDTQRPR